MGTEEPNDTNQDTNKDAKLFDLKMKCQPHIKTEARFTISDHDYNGGREHLPASQSSSENISIKNAHVKSELECTNNVYANHSLPTTQKFASAVCATCPTKWEEHVTPLRNAKRKACYDIHIKQEAIDVNNENCSIQNDPLPVNPGMIKMENGCTNSECNSHTHCLQTFKCNKCSLVFTEKQMFAIHYKGCTSEIPLVLSTNSNGIVLHRTSYESSRDLKKFIEKVREHPCLYNVNNNDYINNQLKNLLWTELASEFNFADGIAAKVAWKRLVDHFRESLKHSQINAKHFKYQKQMEFLLPYMNSAIRNEHLSNEQTESVTVVSDDMDTDDVHIVQQVMSPTKKQRVMPSSTINETLNASIRSIREKKSRRSSSSQPLDMFFSSMCETTKNLPTRLQILVKKKVFQAVIEAEEAATTMTSDAASDQGIFPFRTNPVTAVVDNSSSSQED